MTNKGITAAVIIVAVLIVGGLAYWYYHQGPSSQVSSNTQSGPQGTLVLGLKDAAANMGAISSVNVTVSKIEVHSQAQGWITVSTDAHQYDLLALKKTGSVALLGQANLSADNYDQVRLAVDKASVTENGSPKDAKLPSGQLTMNVTSTVSANSISTAVFDVLADKSLHVIGNGQYVFTPVINIETRQNATASVDSSNALSMSGGTVQADGTVGMDVNGQMKSNFSLNANTNLDVVGNLIQATTSSVGLASSAKVDANTAAQTAVNGGYLDSAASASLIKQNGTKVWDISGMKAGQATDIMVNAATGAVINGNASAQSSASSGQQGSQTQSGQQPQGQPSNGSSGSGVNAGGSGGVQVQY